MGTAAPGCPVERSSTSTAEKLLAPGVLKGHGFCGCGKTLGAESFERAWLQPCHPATNPTQAPQGPSLLAPQYSSTANDRASICPRIIWEGHGFSGCGPESFERAWLQPCHPATNPTQAPQGPTRSANPSNPIVILRQWSRARKRATPNEGSLYFPPRPGPSNIKRVAQS